MSVKNVAIVGLGIGKSHIEEAYSKQPELFRVAAICDLNEARLAEIGDAYGIARRTTSFDEVLAMQDIDIVDVCTPPGLHFEQIVASLKAGKHVICEKPLVGSLAQIDEVAAVERQSRGRVMPIFQYRFGNGFQKAKLLVDSGIAGRPYVATAETFWTRGAAYYSVPWRGKVATELGGALLTHAIHIHDMLCGLIGDIESVAADAITRVNTIEVEDCAVAALRMTNGALASLAVTLGSSREMSRLHIAFENVTMESSHAPYSPGDEPWTFIPANDEAKARIEEAFASFEPVPRRFAGQMLRYHAALDAGTDFPVTLADARRSLELITALYASSDTGQRIRLPIAAGHDRYANWTRRG
ncbi:Gfo/Idh/MocA family oxidoreductase [Alsobacter sp. SYSU M60028]|uniref:Gfo/Idh/MocA family oxidoreductase n=1 Tax=Alsobacter ponti TaxID=2962936 RepID=A0ABT1LFP1_9HYPH|nr:Gfo/Idh/MocA family oxidoreductase [Alsobacter ponti]MCP8940320.1 Gfo/Idh/MocA family oxidoreductase [Alsobacter ponti]